MFPFASAKEKIKALTGPKYDGKYLHKLLKEKLGNTRLHQTLTNVVIPTFDIKRLHPTIFSSYEVYYYHAVVTVIFIISYICACVLYILTFAYIHINILIIQVRRNPSLDALLSDICIGTSAAPTYLPAHQFQVTDPQGEMVREFNLIDGGVAANNPVRI